MPATIGTMLELEVDALGVRQACEELDAVCSVTAPDLHAVHDVEPAMSENVLVGQSRQVPALVARADLDHVPMRHDWHAKVLVAATDDDQLPASQD